MQYYKRINTLNSKIPQDTICLSPDGNLLAHTTQDGRVYLRDYQSVLNKIADN